MGVDSAEALTQLGDVRAGMFRSTAGYKGMLLTLGEHEIDLGPYTEIYTMDKILNMKEARRDREEQKAEHWSVADVLTLLRGTGALPNPVRVRTGGARAGRAGGFGPARGTDGPGHPCGVTETLPLGQRRL
ncbi:hypothetical protein [Streptomyces sp. NPDC055186]